MAGGTFNNSKASFTLEDGLCVCVCVFVNTSVFSHASESFLVCVCAVSAHESNTISLQRAVLAVPVAPDTHPR